MEFAVIWTTVFSILDEWPGLRKFIHQNSKLRKMSGLDHYARDNDNFVFVLDADIFVLAENLVIG